jgi:predicted DCC family thiol-disulfide oxidoreductase YuxK
MGALSGLGSRIYRHRIHVLYDGNCKLCRRTIRICRALDFLDQFVPIDALDTEARARAGLGHLDFDALMREMHVAAGPRVWSGYAACRVIAGRSPLLWPVVPFLYIWPVPSIGRGIYRRVARSRSCQVPAVP